MTFLVMCAGWTPGMRLTGLFNSDIAILPELIVNLSMSVSCASITVIPYFFH